MRHDLSLPAVTMAKDAEPESDLIDRLPINDDHLKRGGFHWRRCVCLDRLAHPLIVSNGVG
jgi:hypothetical protein